MTHIIQSLHTLKLNLFFLQTDSTSCPHKCDLVYIPTPQSLHQIKKIFIQFNPSKVQILPLHCFYLFAKASLPKLVPSSNLGRPLLPNMVKPSLEKKTPNSINKMQRHFKGVRMRKWGKWVSEVRVPHLKGKGKIWLGSYDTPQQAARAYDCAVYCLRGSQAKFNFPDSVPEIPSASLLSPAQIQAVAAELGKGESRQVLDCNTTFSGSESVSGVYSHQSLEEQDLALLDSLLEEVESLEFPIMEDFLPLDELLEDIDFLKDFCSTGCTE